MAGNTIVLKGKGHHEEGVLDEVVSPGMAIKLAADGNYDQWDGAASGERDEILIAKEDALQGKTVADDYAVGDIVSFFIPLPGDVVQVLVKDGETIAIGDKLIREDGTGLFIETTGTPEAEDFVAVEAVSPSGSNGLVSARRI